MNREERDSTGESAELHKSFVLLKRHSWIRRASVAYRKYYSPAAHSYLADVSRDLQTKTPTIRMDHHHQHHTTKHTHAYIIFHIWSLSLSVATNKNTDSIFNRALERVSLLFTTLRGSISMHWPCQCALEAAVPANKSTSTDRSRKLLVKANEPDAPVIIRTIHNALWSDYTDMKMRWCRIHWFYVFAYLWVAMRS